MPDCSFTVQLLLGGSGLLDGYSHPPQRLNEAHSRHSQSIPSLSPGMTPRPGHQMSSFRLYLIGI